MKVCDTRDYQWKAVSFLASAIRDGHRKLGLSSPTGSGKTIMVVALLLKSRALLDGVVLATPSRPVLTNFHKNWRIRLVAPSFYGDRPPFPLEGDRDDMFVLLDSQHNKRKLFDDILRPGRVDFQWVALTTMQQLTRWGVGCMPPDLKGKLLILDEGHHAGSGDEDAVEDPQIGKFAQEWVARGGMVLWVTATPFRSDEKAVFPEDAKAFIWTIADHAADHHAPDQFKIQTNIIPDLGITSPSELGGSYGPQQTEDLDKAVAAMVYQWREDGYPKAVFVVPAGSSLNWAERLWVQIGNERPTTRVLDVVGMDTKKSTDLNEALRHEQQVEKYEDSRIDVILACRRFDEGTDWPLASHIYGWGIPESFRLILQRWGRTFRLKLGVIEGYPEAAINVAKIVFIIPQVKPELLKQFEADHHDHALLTACYMAKFEVARDIASDMRIRWEAHWIRRPNRDPLDHINSEQAWKVPVEVETKLRAAVIKFEAAHKARTGRVPTQGEILDHLSEGLSEAEEQALLYILAERLPSDQVDADEDFNIGLKNLGTLDVVKRSDIKEVFRALVTQFRDATFTDFTNKAAVRIYSQFTGAEATEVGRLLAGRQLIDIPDIEVLTRVVRPYRAKYGKSPDLLGGNVDVSDLLGTEATLFDVDKMLRKRGFDLARLMAAEHVIDGPPLDPQVLRKHLSGKPLPRLHPNDMSDAVGLRFALKSKNYDLKKYGLNESFIGLVLACEFGWRGLRPGTSLQEILRPPVQKEESVA